MPKIIHTRLENLPAEVNENDNDYGYIERAAVPGDCAVRSLTCFYEVPPGKSNFPYHYHLAQEETFYIISGEGLLKTPEGERPVRAGDLLFFPAGESGAHKLTNTSATETLVYLDFDTIADMDVAVYPDSDKVAIWSPSINKVYRMKDNVPYYEGE